MAAAALLLTVVGGVVGQTTLQWQTGPLLPFNLGEVSACQPGDGFIYAMGEGDPRTLQLKGNSAGTYSWTILPSTANRPFNLHHMPVAAWNGLCYFMGGLGGSGTNSVCVFFCLCVCVCVCVCVQVCMYVCM